MTTFLDTEPCPACNTSLHLTDTGSALTQDCPACGLNRTWQAALTGGSR